MSNLEAGLPEQKPPCFTKQLLGGYSAQDVDAFVHQALKELAELKVELLRARADSGVAQEQLEASRQTASSLEDQQKSERQLLQVLTDRVDELSAQLQKQSAESESVDDILRAAHTAAQQLRADAQKDSEQMLRLAESRVERVIAEMRQRAQELQAEYEIARREYAEFLSKARALAHNFIRQVDEKDSPL